LRSFYFKKALTKKKKEWVWSPEVELIAVCQKKMTLKLKKKYSSLENN